jgi:hypothetical protein
VSWFLIVVALFTPPPYSRERECRDVCEVLDMRYVRFEPPCDCLCYDPVSKSTEAFVHPACIR